MSLKRCWSWAMGGNDPPMDDSMTKTCWGFHRAVGHHHEDSQCSAHVLQTRSFQSFSFFKTVGCCSCFFQKLGLAGLGCLSFSCSSRACRPKLMNRWLLLSHARLCATPSHHVTRYRIGSLKSSATSISTMPWASGRSTKEHTKGLRPGWCFWMVSWCFLMKLMKLWHPQPETGWDSTDLSELWWPT